MEPMNITEFLEARIAEDEAQATKHLPSLSSHGLGDYGLRVLAECEAKRAIIEQHQNWPVYVESEPSELEQVASGLNDVTYRMTRQMAWLTTREYVKRFGTEPPTAPMIRTLAAVYKDHPDYQQEWAL